MKTVINTNNAPQPIGPYNQAIIINKILYTSGQIAIEPISNKLILSSIEEETHQVMKNISAILNAAGCNFESIFKATIFIKNMNDFNKINTIYGQYFNDENAPVRETVEVARLPKDVNIEISVMATVPV